MNTIELVAGTYGIGMSLAPLLQARRMRQRRSSEDVSITYHGILIVGFGLYLLYGISIDNRLLIVTNTASVIVTAAISALRGRCAVVRATARQACRCASASDDQAVRHHHMALVIDALANSRGRG